MDDGRSDLVVRNKCFSDGQKDVMSALAMAMPMKKMIVYIIILISMLMMCCY